jgi:hypothetical protein
MPAGVDDGIVAALFPWTDYIIGLYQWGIA